MGKSVGIILMILGLVMLVWTGFTYTKKEKIVDAGPIEITSDKKESVNWPPFAGGIALVAGVLVFIASKKN
ncbi:hypothetical protein [Pedobacter flavus]|uniref:DUF3185 domain-containing protein n=1 Tax=Pedobacter flavus TaxID=3113906 RepID=A0ABU7H412_9SPHI|nr:hypothetical protein [Pedobacter sp. VNH31]MEE1885782.1 hypothetical protein [Pedobacter sp. VNH31]